MFDSLGQSRHDCVDSHKGTHLDTRYRTQHQNCTVKDAQRALDLYRKIDVTLEESDYGEPTREKKVWKESPGVSMILIAYFSCSPVVGDFAFQSQNVAALWMVMPFSRSSSILSIFAPTLSFPLTYTFHVQSQKA